MITKPLLVLPNFKKEFVVEIDACDEGLGTVLMQQDSPIAYMSKALAERHRSLSIYEKVMLAIVLALQKLGRHFKTDHQSLKFLIQ